MPFTTAPEIKEPLPLGLPLIFGAYVVISIIYLIFSDFIVTYLVADPQLVMLASQAKGIAFVLISCWLGYRILLRSSRFAQQAKDALERARRLSVLTLDALPLAILTTDRTGVVTAANKFSLTHGGYRPDQILGRPISALTVTNDIPILEHAIQRAVAGDVVEAVIRMRHADGRIVPYRIQATVLRDPAGGDLQVLGVGIDIARQLRDERRLAKTFDGLGTVLEQTVTAMGTVIEKRDPYTAGHQARVAALAVRVAQKIGLDAAQANGLRLASLCHDVGKVSVPADILNKPGMLSAIEFDFVRTHARAGHDILTQIDFPWPIADIVLQHHERLDGSGYPQGLRGDQILLEARILAVCDIVDAMTSDRPYRTARGIDAARDELRRGRGELYDPAVVDACLIVIAEHGLDNGDQDQVA